MFKDLSKALNKPSEVTINEEDDLIMEAVAMESVKAAFLSEDNEVTLESFGDIENDEACLEAAFESICEEMADLLEDSEV